MAVADPKITVDDHLLEMVDNITKLSARVWSMLFEHLRSVGVDDKSTRTSDTSPVAEGTNGTATAATAEEDAAGADSNPAAGSDSDKEAPEEDRTNATSKSECIQDESASTQNLRDLKELAQITDDLTSQLRSTYLRAREEEQRRTSPPKITENPIVPSSSSSSDAAFTDTVTTALTEVETVETETKVVTTSADNISATTVTKLFDESHQFVRAIVDTSTLIKSISVEHEFPRDLRRMLGQVAQACSNLTVYLLWLSPATVS